MKAFTYQRFNHACFAVTKVIYIYQGLKDCLFSAPGIYNLRQCPNCCLIWLDPRPAPQDIERLYTNYFTHDIAIHLPRLASLRKTIRDAVLFSYLGYTNLMVNPLEKCVGRIIGWIGPVRKKAEMAVMTIKGPPKGRLLDISRGNGQFLAKMQGLGWDVIGVELDRQAVKMAREIFNLSIHEGTLEETNFPDNTFNAIIMIHVIEHIWDPIGTLKECRRIIEPGGKLVIVTPNLKSVGHRLFREAGRGLDVPRHLYLFSSDTLRSPLNRRGLGSYNFEPPPD